MTKTISLVVNDKSIELDYFVQDFVDHTVNAMVSTLEGVGDIKKLDIYVRGDETSISVNDAMIPINPFVNKIVRNTLIGMVSSLKGVSEIKTIYVGTMK